ncbi:MAG: hypothetical protein JWP59_3018, partial [Massilia sp.]|nr:hypothetical protein [Massilia sp.]
NFAIRRPAAATLWIEAPPAPRPGDTAPASDTSPVNHKSLVNRTPQRRFSTTFGMLAGAARHAATYGLTRRPLMLLPYLGYGSAGALTVRGRVLQERAFSPQQAGDSGWRNLAALYRRLESDEVAGEAVAATFDGQTYLTRTDNGGYFSFDIRPSRGRPPAPGWVSVELALPDAAAEHGEAGGPPVRAAARVLVPDGGARFGVISDIDDTVLWTNVTNKLNMALMLARSNPYTRQPFKGVAAFYRALHAGAPGAGVPGRTAPGDSRPGAGNPLFYVSSSPWHLFGHLVEFLRAQGLPLGPLMLRELGLKQLLKLNQHGNHKLEKIEHILATYPTLPFILIGDSGEQDPEIYAEVVRRHPGKVRVIYIRNVNPDPARIAALDRLVARLAAAGTELIVAADSEAAAVHAAREGLIDPARLEEVRADVRAAGAA